MRPQWLSVRESAATSYLDRDMDKIIDQFDFVFVMERMRASFECACMKLGMRLCSQQMRLKQRNIRQKNSCVEKQLIKFRFQDLMRGDELDLLLYEAAGARLDQCRNISEHCKCPE